VKINQFQQQTASDFSASLAKLSDQNMKSLIVDLRDNPGGLLRSAVKTASQFIPSGKLIVYTKNRQGKKKEFKSSDNTPYTAIPVVVLVNEGSASASEIFAGALKDWGRATIVGTLTFGKGSVQTIVPLKDGSALKLTTARYYTPKGISIQTTGISPDVVVKTAIRDGQQVRPVIREKDLEGHLANGQETEAVPVSEETAFRTTDDYEDPQLQRAIYLLRHTKY
jgi:carboxyl-terminal processing protease